MTGTFSYAAKEIYFRPVDHDSTKFQLMLESESFYTIYIHLKEMVAEVVRQNLIQPEVTDATKVGVYLITGIFNPKDANAAGYRTIYTLEELEAYVAYLYDKGPAISSIAATVCSGSEFVGY